MIPGNIGRGMGKHDNKLSLWVTHLLLQGKSENSCRTLLRVPTGERDTHPYQSLFRALTGGTNSLGEWAPACRESPQVKRDQCWPGKSCSQVLQRQIPQGHGWSTNCTSRLLQPKDLCFCGSRSDFTFLLFSAFRTNLDVWT